MNSRSLTLVSILSVFLFVGAGCHTDEPGNTYAMGTYTAMVDSSPDKVAKATKKAMEDLKFKDITAVSTEVDGKVTAKTAQDSNITIDIQQAGTNVSKVTIRVGAGDETVSRQIFDRIRDNVH